MSTLALGLRLNAARGPRSLMARAISAIRRAGGTVLGAGAATPVLGPNLVTNGDFSNGTAGWTAQSGWSISGGAASVNSSVAGATYLRTSGYSAVAGTLYIVTFTVTAYTSGSIAAAAGTGVSASPATGVGTYTIGVTASGSGGVGVFATGTNTVATIDNISVKEVLGYTYGNPPVRNYFDSAGTDILDSVTQVDQPVGLALDAAGTVGPELITASWTSSGTGVSEAGGVITFASSPLTDNCTNAGTVTSGKTYEFVFSVSGFSGNGISFMHGGNSIGAIIAANGVHRQILAATSSGQVGVRVRGGTTSAVVSNISVSELPGNHATQPTTASKPTLLRGLVNQLTQSDFQNGVTDAPTRGGLVTASTLAGYGGALAFGHDGSTTSHAYKQVTHTAGVPHTFFAIVRMDDGNPPVFTSASNDSGNPFALVVCLSVPSPLTYTVTPLPDGAYMVSGVITPGTSVTGNNGVVKYNTNNNRTFKVTRYGLFRGTVTAAQILAAGGIPVTTTAPASSTGGRPYWGFDGSNDFLQTGITTGNEGWVCAGVTFLSTGVQAIFGSGALSGNLTGVMLFLSSGFMRLACGNASASTTYVGGAAPAVGVPSVCSAGWGSGNAVIGVNGVEVTNALTDTIGTSTNVTGIGANKSGLAVFNGPMSAFIYTPVLPSAADRALIRKWIGSLQGQTL